MKIVTDGKYSCSGSVIVLGMFDGVHIGHRVLLQRGRALADQYDVPLIVATFAQHPREVIFPDQKPSMLTTFEEKTRLFEELGVDVLLATNFTREVMNMPPEEYIGHMVRLMHPRQVVCGYNHSFGAKGSGNPALLEAIGNALGFGTSIVPKITYEGMDCSSTQIRSLLNEGDVATAHKLLARYYSLKLGEREDGLYCCQKEKQLPAPGRYRVLLKSENGKTIPSVITLKEELLGGTKGKHYTEVFFVSRV